MQKLLALSAVVGFVAAYRNNFAHEDEVINQVNNHPTRTWIAGKNTRFANYTMDDMISMMGTLVDEDAPYVGANDLLYDDVIGSLPSTFDGREKWGKCVHPVRNQEKCGSCWAFAASEALSDRFCIAGKDVILSPQYLVACDRTDLGCHGGQLRNVWEYMSSRGVPSDECEPYTAGAGNAGPCQKTCKDGEKPVIYKASNAYSVVSFFDPIDKRVNKIKAEIFKNGPVEAAFTVYQDFMSYRGGVYKHVTGPVMGGHAIKVVGWGEEAGTPYWIIANSWGEDWGESGYFRIAQGSNECGIESNVYAGLPDLTTGPR